MMSMVEEPPATLGPAAVSRRVCALRSCTLAMHAAKPQTAWANTTVAARLRVLRRARHSMAIAADDFAAAISPALARTRGETLSAELLPLLFAIRMLERRAASLLAPRNLGLDGRPVLLTGVAAEVHREPLGHILIIAPANFPLLLAGVQTMQALAAGNRVTWKPAPGGGRVAQLVAEHLRRAGLPDGLLTVTDESIEAAQAALAEPPDKVIFTGSAHTGQAVLRQLAETTTPAVMELSGADAVVVLPQADLPLVARAVNFGLRLNGSAVCMSPRRLFADSVTMQRLRPLLQQALADIPAVELAPRTAGLLSGLLDEATADGARVLGELEPTAQRPILLDKATPLMAATRTDIFAPLLSLIELPTLMTLPEAYAQCPYALGLSIFCGPREERAARQVAKMLRAGTVLINDMIAPTVDPRIPFGGRGASGFGATRGEEGLLEMTAAKVLLVRRGGSTRHLDPLRPGDEAALGAIIGLTHSGSWKHRLKSLLALMGLRQKQPSNNHSARNA